PVTVVTGVTQNPATGVVTVTTTTQAQTVYSYSGDTIRFVNVGGQPVAAPYRPIRGQGGFFELGFPLSRIFHANPDGRNAGWRFFVGYGVDSAFARDVRNAGTRLGGNGLERSDYVPVSLRYKLNRWAELINEVTWYDTRTADADLTLFRGINAH